MADSKKAIVLIVLAILTITACSSSSISKRYNKPQEEEKSISKSIRFTSEDDAVVKPTQETTKSVVMNNYTDEFDEEPYDDVLIDTKEFIKSNKVPTSLYSTLTKREKILFEVVSYLETPYKYGGESYSGIDCSAFTQNVFNKALGASLPRTASEQYNIGEFEKSDLEFGDLVFFNTRKEAYPGHVGLYLGNNLFAHASSTQGVTVSSLKSSYYAQRFVGAKRIKNLKK